LLQSKLHVFWWQINELTVCQPIHHAAAHLRVSDVPISTYSASIDIHNITAKNGSELAFV
jgi:hypothetical protein